MSAWLSSNVGIMITAPSSSATTGEIGVKTPARRLSTQR